MFTLFPIYKATQSNNWRQRFAVPIIRIPEKNPENCNVGLKTKKFYPLMGDQKHKL